MTTTTDTQNIQEKKEIDPRVAEIREKLQQDIVNLITSKLEKGEMTEERAKAIARMTLDKLPEDMTYDQLMRTIPTLDDEFDELKIAVYPIIDDYQRKVAAQVQEQLARLIKENKLGAALDLANKAIIFEEQLG